MPLADHCIRALAQLVGQIIGMTDLPKSGATRETDKYHTSGAYRGYSLQLAGAERHLGAYE
ncbi:MAG: hypothetical protein QGH15_23750, partial [Kiritimatiellia bacterium]|nr:hypothetical protein [Kiritimatiellia bacterium]